MNVFHHTCYAMGTRFNLVIPNMEDDAGEIMARAVDAILKEEEQRMSRYVASSELSYINSFASEKVVKVSDEMFKIINLCARYYRDTMGAFDPTWLGKTVGKHEKTSPSNHSNQDKDGFGEVIYNKEKKTIRFLSPGTLIDLGGFGKGWALDKIVAYLNHNAVSSAFISFGESSITATGEHPMGGPWKVDIPHPDWKNGTMRVELFNQSVSVSGLKKNSDSQQNKGKGHIFSSRANRLIEDNRMALVKSASAVESEVLSTALIASDHEQKEAILNTFEKAAFFEDSQYIWQPLVKSILIQK